MKKPPSWREAADGLRNDLARVFGERLRSLVVYDAHGASRLSADPDAESPGENLGPGRTAQHQQLIHSMAVVDSLRMDDLKACAASAAGWAGRGLATPLLMTGAEVERSLDAFPLEFSEIVSHHVVLVGSDPFEHLGVKPEDLRRACEVQARSHLLHLREGFIEAGGRPAAVAELIAASARPFRGLLASLATLQGVSARTSDALATHAQRAIGVPAAVVKSVLQVSRPKDLNASDAVRLYAEYLDTVERVTRFVDEWTR